MAKKKVQSKSIASKVSGNKWVLAFIILAAIAGGLYAIKRSHADGCGDGYTIEWASGYVEYVPETQGCGYGYDPSAVDENGLAYDQGTGANPNFDYSACQCGGDPSGDDGSDWWDNVNYGYGD